jgi:hypothetical protein
MGWMRAGLAVVVSLTYLLIKTWKHFPVPPIMGRSLNLHPIVVLVAVLVGANLWGVLGVVLAAPIAATLRLLGRYMRGKLLEEDVFPTEGAYIQHTNRFYLRLIHVLLSKRFPPIAERPAPPRAAEMPRALIVAALRREKICPDFPPAIRN